MNKKISYIIKFFNFEKSNQLSIIYILMLLLQAKFLLRMIPLKYYYNEAFSHKTDCTFDLQRYQGQFSLFKKVTKKIPMHVTCLEESLALRFYFRKFNIDLPIYLGIRIDNNNALSAHAWSIFEDLQVNNYKRIN